MVHTLASMRVDISRYSNFRRRGLKTLFGFDFDGIEDVGSRWLVNDIQTCRQWSLFSGDFVAKLLSIRDARVQCICPNIKGTSSSASEGSRRLRGHRASLCWSSSSTSILRETPAKELRRRLYVIFRLIWRVSPKIFSIETVKWMQFCKKMVLRCLLTTSFSG